MAASIPDHSLHHSNHPIPNHRATIGFLLASLHTGASRALLPGVLEAAESRDVNKICFPGGRLNATDAFESQRNAIYDLAGVLCLDGLITWSSSLGGMVGPAEIKIFHERYRNLPMVSMGQFMEGMPTVSVDSYHGMRALLAHLIEVHGYQRIAFVRGPEGHFYAQERYRAYLDTLKAHQIPLQPELVTRPLRWESGAEAVQIFLDERGLRPGADFQAVVASSDLLAVWALKGLQARGFQIPGDVAVTGYNNSIEERLAAPPLTTVDLPFYNQGARSVEVLLALLAGENVPALITLPSNVVVRKSCGCPSAAVSRAGELRGHMPVPVDWKAECLAEMAAVQVEPGIARSWLAPLLDALQPALEGPNPAAFLSSLEAALDQVIQNRSEIHPWQDLLSILRRYALSEASQASRAAVEAVFSQARVVVSEAVQRGHAYWQWQAERRGDSLRETNRALLTTFNVQQLTDVLTERLHSLGIPSAYLALYGRICAGNAAICPPGAGLHRSETRAAGAWRPALSRAADHPTHLLPRQRRYSLVVEPLYFQDKSIGYAVFEIGPQDGDVYELLRGNLSSAIQGAALFEEIQRARYIAEKADRIKTRLLANVSHELRTPLNIILGYTRNTLQLIDQPGTEIHTALAGDIQQIQDHAEHQLRVINDLLDLSRAEIDELDLALELINPRPLLSDVFQGFTSHSAPASVTWKLDLPERLSLIRADAVRLRQILLNLLSNARKFTTVGQIVLGAEILPPDIHIWVSDTGPGIPCDQQERIFEPFVTLERDHVISGGIGLGLSITRHLVALHGGKLTLDSEPGRGSTFHIRIPLPALEQGRSTRDNIQSVLLLISSTGQALPEIQTVCRKLGLEMKPLQISDDLETVLTSVRPAAIAWDLSSAQPGDWSLVRHLRSYPALSQSPFILFGQPPRSEAGEAPLSVGLTGFVVKSAGSEGLIDAINALCPDQLAGAILIVDDDSQVRADHLALVRKSLPGCAIKTAESGEDALIILEAEVPALVLLDLMMPGMDGTQVLDQMRSDPRLRQVPVIILSNKILSLDDVKRFEHHAHVTFQTKGMWSVEEAAEAINRASFGIDGLPPQTSALVKRVIAFLHQNYARSLSRWEIAAAVGMSEDYLTRTFTRELGISPGGYLNRFRVLQAKSLLQTTTQSIGAIAHQVGFNDQAYFSRIFKQLAGSSPQAYREKPE